MCTHRSQTIESHTRVKVLLTIEAWNVQRDLIEREFAGKAIRTWEPTKEGLLDDGLVVRRSDRISRSVHLTPASWPSDDPDQQLRAAFSPPESDAD